MPVKVSESFPFVTGTEWCTKAPGIRRLGGHGQDQVSRLGFTLIELIICVIIAAILAVLLLPAIQKTRASSEATRCLKSLKALGNGMLLYAADHGGWFPQYPDDLPPGDLGFGKCWDVAISPYLGVRCQPGSAAYATYEGPPCFHCPSGIPWRTANVPVNKSRGYAANYNIALKTTFDDIRNLSRVPLPAKLGILFEVWRQQGDFHTELLFGGGIVNFQYLNYFPGFKDKLAWRHSGRMNIYFADGHVALTPPSETGNGFPKGVVWYWRNGLPIGD